MSPPLAKQTASFNSGCAGVQAKQSRGGRPEKAATGEPRHAAPASGRGGRARGGGPARQAKPATPPPAAITQSKAPKGSGSGQRLKQVAAKARAENLRSALQQLRASKPPPPPPPQTAQPLQQEQHTTAAPAVPGRGADELDSDLEDLFDDISLSLLARLRLGGSPQQRQAGTLRQPDPAGAAQAQGRAAQVLGSARQALREAAADAEMPPPAAHGQVAAGSDLTVATATMQLRLEQLRASLSSPGTSAPQPLPPTGLDMTDGVHQTQPAAVAAVAVTAEPRRQRLAAAELVVTRPPKPATRDFVAVPAQYAPAAALGPSWPSLHHHAVPQQQQCSSSSSLYSSSGCSAAARLAALLPQPQQQTSSPAPASHRPQAQSSMGEHAFSSSVLRSERGSRPLLPPPVLDSRGLPPRACSRDPAALVATPAAEQPGDILEAWRSRRREAQAGQLADKYGRYLSLQQLPAPAPDQEPAHVYAAGAPLPSTARLRGDWAGGAPCAPAVVGLSHQQRHLDQQQQQASSVVGSSSPPADGGGDILERWRARRRQQQQQQGSIAARATADYGSLLTLSLPGSAPAPPSQAPALPARSTMHILPGPQQVAAAVAGLPPAVAEAAAEAAQGDQADCASSRITAAASMAHSGKATQPSAVAAGGSAALLADAQEAGAAVAPLAAAVAPAPLALGIAGSCSSHLALLTPPELSAADSEQAAAGHASSAAAEAAAAESSAPSRQPSRPASTTSTCSGRATPRSSLALDRCAALHWLWLHWLRCSWLLLHASAHPCATVPASTHSAVP